MTESSPNGLLLQEVLDRVDGFLAREQAISLPAGRWTTPEMLDAGGLFAALARTCGRPGGGGWGTPVEIEAE